MEIGVIDKAPAAEVALWQQDYSGDAERAVIGSMLIDAACVKDVLNAVEADDFSSIPTRRYSPPYGGCTWRRSP